jgi:hypothetical protein
MAQALSPQADCMTVAARQERRPAWACVGGAEESHCEASLSAFPFFPAPAYMQTCARAPHAPPCPPFPLLQQVNLVAVAGRGLHLSISTMRFLLSLQSSLQPRLRLQLIESWDCGERGYRTRIHGTGLWQRYQGSQKQHGCLRCCCMRVRTPQLAP